MAARPLAPTFSEWDVTHLAVSGCSCLNGWWASLAVLDAVASLEPSQPHLLRLPRGFMLLAHFLPNAAQSGSGNGGPTAVT